VYEPPKGSHSDKWTQAAFQTAHGRVEGDITNMEEEPSGELVENVFTRNK